MTLKAQMTADIETVFLNTNDFAETGTVTPVSGPSFSIAFIRNGTSDLAAIDPGYADMDQFCTSKAQYAEPHIGDTITDADGAAWLVEPGARISGDWWTIPVKADRRLRS